MRGAVELAGRWGTEGTEGGSGQGEMASEFARDAKARVKDVLTDGRGLRSGGEPRGAIPHDLMSVEVLEPVEAAGGGCGPSAMGPHGFGVTGGIALVIVDFSESAG